MRKVTKLVPEPASHSSFARAPMLRNRRRHFPLWLALFACALWAKAQSHSTPVLTPQPQPGLQGAHVQATTHVTVIDPGTGAKEQRDMTILLRDSKIAAVENLRRHIFLPERRSMMGGADTSCQGYLAGHLEHQANLGQAGRPACAGLCQLSRRHQLDRHQRHSDCHKLRVRCNLHLAGASHGRTAGHCLLSRSTPEHLHADRACYRQPPRCLP